MSTFNRQQAAAFLHMHPITLLKKAQAGLVPGAKLAKRWVFLQVDLEQYVRSQYAKQVLQGDNHEVALCHSTKEVISGGSVSGLKVLAEYNNLLEPEINKRLRNTKRLLKLVSGSKHG